MQLNPDTVMGSEGRPAASWHAVLGMHWRGDPPAKPEVGGECVIVCADGERLRWRRTTTSRSGGRDEEG